MKQLYKTGLTAATNTFVMLLFCGLTFAQITTTTSSGRNSSKTPEAIKAEAQVREVTAASGQFFNQGLLGLQDNLRSKARENFDKSVEVFLSSGVNVQRNTQLRECYNQLLETVYRIEFPLNNQEVQIIGLSAICGWEIKKELADNVVSQILKNRTADNAQNDKDAAVAKTISDSFSAGQDLIGFTDQSFEASPRDELAKFELTDDEENTETPELRQEYEVIRIAGNNQSLGFSFQMHQLVQQFINYYRGRGRRTMEVGLYRSGYFMTMARRIFREEGVPENVAWLGQVESAWKPTAHSWAAAAGLWQFIPGTGARYGLRRTAYLDERQSFEKATRASARYLKFLANRYNGNWELAMAGYNCGEGNVDKAIRRAGSSNFWAAYPYLPRETRNYVPNILATIIIANNPHQYGFGHVRPAPRLKYDRVRVPSTTGLGLLAQASNSSVEYLRYLNPELRTNSTPPEPYVIRIPAGSANNVVAVLRSGQRIDSADGRLASTLRGETWESISRKTGVTVEDLKEANPGMRTPAGRVYVPVKGNGVTATSYSRPSGDTVVKPTMTVKGIRVVEAEAGETVAKLAVRLKVDAGDVAKLNGLLPESKLHKGRQIRIPVK